MNIILSGIETKNKGAELMLYAILQEIERKFPKATVYIPRGRIFYKNGLEGIRTKVNITYLPCYKMEKTLRLGKIYRVLHIPYTLMPHTLMMNKVNYFLDASGFRFSDQFKMSSREAFSLKSQLSAYRGKGAKIIFLPQAFGPFEKETTKEVLSVLSSESTLIMPRESVSLKYIAESGVVDMKKVRKFTDFTSLVEGVFPSQYEYLRDGICIIPNKQMINKGAISMDNYLSLLKAIIDMAKKSGRVVYLLNHEGKNDELLCEDMKKELYNDIEYVSGLNALEVKGMIASAYLVITSRFHGLASSLNSGVPSLATSWSHKYEELFKDYGLDASYVLPLSDIDIAQTKVNELLESHENKRVHSIIESKVPEVKTQTCDMWNLVWNS